MLLLFINNIIIIIVIDSDQALPPYHVHISG